MSSAPSNCRSVGIGPNCQVPERGDGEQHDCLEKAIRQCRGQLNECIGKAKSLVFSTQGLGSTLSTLWQMDPASRLAERMAKMSACFQGLDCNFRECYCSQWECSTCLPEVNGLSFGPKVLEDAEQGPTLDGFSITTSSYDRVIERVYGTHKVSGNVIWTSDLTATERYDVTYDSSTNLYTRILSTSYRLSFALGLCAGEIQDVTRIWIGDDLIYSTRNEDADELITAGQRYNSSYTEADAARPYNTAFGKFRIHKGSESQYPDPLMGNDSPGYRGLAYIMFEDFDVTQLGGTLPDIEVEVVRVLSAAPAEVSSNIAHDTASTLGGGSAQILYVSPLENEIVFGATGSVATSNRPGFRILNYDSLSERSAVAPGINLVSDTAYDLSTLIRISSQYFLVQNSLSDTYLLRSVSPVEAVHTDTIGPYSRASLGGVFRTSPVASAYGAALVIGTDLSFYAYNTAGQSLDLLGTFADFPGERLVRTKEYAFVDTEVPRVVEYLTGFALGPGNTEIVVKRLVLNSSEGPSYFDMTQAPASYSIPAGEFGGSVTDASILDVFYVAKQGLFLITSQVSGGETYLTAWRPDTGVAWSTEIVPAPHYAANGPSIYDYPSTEYSWIGEDLSIYSIELTTGVVTNTGNVSVQPVVGVQHYNPLEGSITFPVSSSPPNLTKLFYTHRTSAPQGLDAVVLDILAAVGISPYDADVNDISTIDVAGYKANSAGNATATLKQLGEIYSVYFFEQGGKIRANRRGLTTSPVVLTEDDYTHDNEYTFDDDFGQILNVAVTYNKPENAYRGSTQHMRKTQFLRGNEFFDDVTNETYAWPVVLTDDEARQFCERILFEDDYKRRIAKLQLGPKHVTIIPGDVVNLDGEVLMEVTVLTESVTRARELDLREIRPEIYTEGASISGVVDASGIYAANPIPSPRATTPIIFPVPPPAYQTNAEIGGFNAILMAGATSPSSIYYVTSGGAVRLGGTVTEAVNIGSLLTPPSPTRARFSTDNDSVMIIRFEQMPSLVNATKDELLHDFTKNILFVGEEIIQFMNATPVGDGRTVHFTGLLRGLRSTDDTIPWHTPGELCAIYTPESIAKIQINLDQEDDSVINIGAVDGDVDASSFLPIPLEAWNRRAPAPPQVFRSTYASGTIVNFHVIHRDIVYRPLNDDDRYPIASFNQSQTMLAVLAGPYDEKTFAEHVAKISSYDLFPDYIPTDSSYIKRIIPCRLNRSHPIGWHSEYDYDATMQATDGIDAYSGEMHIAVFTFDNQFPDVHVVDDLEAPEGYNIIGRVSGFFCRAGEIPPVQIGSTYTAGLSMHSTQ